VRAVRPSVDGALDDEDGGSVRIPPGALSDHAIERYVQRWRPGWEFADAAAELRKEADRAVLHECPAGSDPIWRTPRGCLLVVSGDGTVRTVLPPKSFAPNRRPRK
jgi:hypothetical protein